MTTQRGIELRSGEFPLDCLKTGVIVMQVNCQGIMEIGKDYRRFKREFPVAYKDYVLCCVGGLCVPGDMEIVQDNGFTIALLFTKAFAIGKRTDAHTDVDKSLCQALKTMFFVYDKPTTFYSGSVNYAESKTYIQQVVENTGHKWIVIKE